MTPTAVKKHAAGHMVTWGDGNQTFVPPRHRLNEAIDEFVEAGGTIEPELTDAEAAEQERREKARQRREELRTEVAGNPPPDSMPGLSDRVAKLEIILGLREPDV